QKRYGHYRHGLLFYSGHHLCGSCGSCNTIPFGKHGPVSQRKKCHSAPGRQRHTKRKSFKKISVLPDLYHPGENATYLRLETGLVYVSCCHLQWNTHSLSAVPTSSIFPARYAEKCTCSRRVQTLFSTHHFS